MKQFTQFVATPPYFVSILITLKVLLKVCRNMSELWQIVCKNIILTLVYLLVFFCELASVFKFAELRSQWPRGLRRRSSVASLLVLWVQIPPVTWTSASCECCVLSGRGLCVELIPRPEESYRVCVRPSVIMDKEKYSLGWKSGSGVLTVWNSSTLCQLQFILYPSFFLSKNRVQALPHFSV